MKSLSDVDRSHVWIAGVVAATAPVLFILCSILWRTPYPLSEAVGLLEDASQPSPSRFFRLDTSYYRPLFHLVLFGLWHAAGSVGTALVSIKLLHLVPITIVVIGLVWRVRPKTPVDAAAATVGIAVLVGSPGFLDNLEIPLNYTIVGMAIALITWILLERDHRWWHGWAIVALAVIAVGFKEQGLVIVPLVVAAWWTRAPGVRRATALTVVGLAAAYVAMRFYARAALPQFEQDVGLGFGTLSPTEAAARFGAFPLWIYLYNAASTAANVLFAEPTGGVFRIVRDAVQGQIKTWEIIALLSSSATTALIGWWGVVSLRRAAVDGWSLEPRLFVLAAAAVAACAALSFNYSRDRLGGMAVVFYALAVFFAVRTAIAHAVHLSRPRWAAASIVLMLLAAAWQVRAVYTIEYTRHRASNNHREWITGLEGRRIEFADRPAYLRIMNSMTKQGTAPVGVGRATYAPWIADMLGEF